MFAFALSVLAGLNVGLCIGKYSGLIGNAFFMGYFHNPPITALQGLMAILFGMLPVGALSMGHFADLRGRQWCLNAGSLLLVGGCVVESLPLFAPHVPFKVLLLGRGTCGLGVGVLLPLLPLYLSEISLPTKRGVAVLGYQTFIAVGVCSAYLLQYSLLTGSNAAIGWKVCLASQLPFAFCLWLCALTAPESPRWLAQNSDQDGLMRELSRLRAPIEQQQLEAEVYSMMSQNKPAPTIEWSGLAAALKEKNSMVALGLMLWVQCSGIDTVTQYAPQIFMNPTGNPEADQARALLCTVCMGLLLVLSKPWPFFIIDSYGRRPLLLGGAIGAPISMAFLALGELLPLSAATSLVWRITGVIAFIVAFNFGVVSVAGVVPPELLTSRVRGKVLAVGIAIGMVLDYAIVSCYLSLRAAMGNAGTFFLYACINTAFAIFAVTQVPETLGCELDADTEGLLAAQGSNDMERPGLANPQD